MISRLLDAFPLYKKSDWNKVFISEAGSDTNTSFKVDGISFDPYYTADEINKDQGFLPKASEKVSLGQVFDFRNGHSPVDELKRSLSHDFDAPVFLIDNTTDISSFDDVQMEYIFPRFHLHDNESIGFIGLLTENYKSKSWIPAFVCDFETDTRSIASSSMLHFKYETKNNLAGFIHNLFSKLDSLDSFDPEKLIINTTLSGQFIKDIVKIRAIKIAWFNYLEGRDLPIKPFRNEITWDTDKTYPEVLLEHSNNVVASIISQADNISLFLKGSADENRILRNSCHIALIESHMDNEIDPGAGSYFLEYVAADLAERALISAGFTV